MLLTACDSRVRYDRQVARVPRVAAMDVVRRENEVEISVEVPGFSAEEVDVTVERNVLTVTARQTDSGDASEGAPRADRRRRTLRRQVVLSEVLDGSRVEANLENGLLTLTVPVAEKAKPQKVAVAAGRRPVLDTTEVAADTTDQDATAE